MRSMSARRMRISIARTDSMSMVSSPPLRCIERRRICWSPDLELALRPSSCGACLRLEGQKCLIKQCVRQLRIGSTTKFFVAFGGDMVTQTSAGEAHQQESPIGSTPIGVDVACDPTCRLDAANGIACCKPDLRHFEGRLVRGSIAEILDDLECERTSPCPSNVAQENPAQPGRSGRIGDQQSIAQGSMHAGRAVAESLE